ncbi:MAG: hypothetical protein IJJ56_12220 [Prevotella sp.]|nr:hypothetical protein [Prevotella sp.]
MHKTLATEFKYADDFEITNENVIYRSDSVFIMLFHMKGKRDNGESAEGNMEYAYEERSMCDSLFDLSVALSTDVAYIVDIKLVGIAAADR